MAVAVRYLQGRVRQGGVVANSRKVPVRRWMDGLNRAMPVLLDTTGIMLLSGSAMTFGLTAGLAASGIGCFFLNWRFNEGRNNKQ